MDGCMLLVSLRSGHDWGAVFVAGTNYTYFARSTLFFTIFLCSCWFDMICSQRWGNKGKGTSILNADRFWESHVLGGLRILSSQDDADINRPSGSSHATLQASSAARDVELSVQAFRASIAEPQSPVAGNKRKMQKTGRPTADEAPSQALVPRQNDEEERTEERWFLALGSKIVGVQHYDGVVSDRESVVLRRQPSNVYDRNAIQVGDPVVFLWSNYRVI